MCVEFLFSAAFLDARVPPFVPFPAYDGGTPHRWRWFAAAPQTRLLPGGQNRAGGGSHMCLRGGGGTFTSRVREEGRAGRTALCSYKRILWGRFSALPFAHCCSIPFI